MTSVPGFVAVFTLLAGAGRAYADNPPAPTPPPTTQAPSPSKALPITLVVVGGLLMTGGAVAVAYDEDESAAPRAQVLGAVRIRHKEPTGTKATEAAFPMVGGPAVSFANSSADFRFAFAVAAFADVLRGGEDAEHWSLATIRDIAKNAAGDREERKQLVALIERAIEIKARVATH